MTSAADSAPILPGSTIGVLGSGQLGRMFAIAARKMGYRVHTLSPDTDTPTGQVADVEIVADYDDLDAVAQFAREVHVVTFEFENVSHAAAETAAKFAPVRPAGRVLHTTQHRLREKTFLRRRGFPVTEFSPIATRDDLTAALARQGAPAILKSAGFGYDGKGQFRLTAADQADAAWDAVVPAGDAQPATGDSAAAVFESFVHFEREVSVVAARSASGEFAHWGVIENHHERGILDLSVAPARVPAAVQKEAIEIARGVLEALDVVGVLCVEFFLTSGGKLIVNELAPRPHNSGHLTFDASLTSQFEQQLRAVCNLPLGDTRLHAPAAMAQLLGDLWPASPDASPDWAAAVANPAVKLHLYGKAEPRPGRKMGHLTALATTVDEARHHVLQARVALARKAEMTKDEISKNESMTKSE
jgi:5-(carboxyamino)imidazole ribonucleotide synthase